MKSGLSDEKVFFFHCANIEMEMEKPIAAIKETKTIKRIKQRLRSSVRKLRSLAQNNNLKKHN